MHKRKSTGARLLTSLIGISPLPGPPVAAYGSIIMPEAFHCHTRSKRIFRKDLRVARPLVIFYHPDGQEGPCVPFSGWDQSPRSGMYLLNVYAVVNVRWRFLTLSLSIADFFSICPKKLLKNAKKFLTKNIYSAPLR